MSRNHLDRVWVPSNPQEVAEDSWADPRTEHQTPLRSPRQHSSPPEVARQADGPVGRASKAEYDKNVTL